MRANLSDRDYEILSAYMDGQLSSGERSKLEERLRARPDLRTALEEMQKTRALLRSAPRRRAPRNFTLTPAMVGERKPRSAPWAGLFPVLSFTSAIAALALMVILTLQLGPASTPQTVAMQPPQAETQMETSRQMPAAEELPAAEEPAAAEAPAAEEAAAASEAPAAEAPAPKAPVEAPPTESAELFSAQPAPTETQTVAEQPAEPGIAAAQPEATPAPTITTAGDTQATLPPVVNWNGVPGIAPGQASGLGMGGGPDTVMTGPGLGGGMGGMPIGGGVESMPGGVYLPPESVEAAEEPAAGEAQPQPTPTPEITPPADPAQVEQPALSGSGPILGVPAPEDGGQILNREAIAGTDAGAVAEEAASAEPAGSEPAAVEPTATAQAVAEAPEQPAEAAAAPELAPEAAPDTAPQQDQRALESNTERGEAQPAAVLGLDRRTLLVVEILLGLIAAAAGGAAFYLWRRRARR